MMVRDISLGSIDHFNITVLILTNNVLSIYIGTPSVLLVPQENQKQWLKSFSWDEVFF